MLCTDIVKIIKACGEAGVDSYKYLGMELTFSTRGPTITTSGYSVPLEVSAIDPDNTSGYTTNTIVEDEVEEEDEDDGIPLDQVMDDLKFTDPEAWDELAQAGEV